jgi:hypothetical protein
MKNAFIQNYVQRWGVVPRCTDVEVIVSDTNGRYQLPDIELLRGQIIVGFSCRVQSQIGGVDTVFSPLGRTVVDQTVINSAYLTLVSDQNRFIENYPLADAVVSGDRQFTPLNNIAGFNPTKSVIEVGNPSTPANKLVVGEAFFLTFYYIDPLNEN